MALVHQPGAHDPLVLARDGGHHTIPYSFQDLYQLSVSVRLLTFDHVRPQRPLIARAVRAAHELSESPPVRRIGCHGQFL